ncbi:MAG: hydroxyacylglutathione hydrolase [Alphaproteobacteria bacterium]|nr:hydroxyacylglutathione hydrolase [Alphaproteobacteria bacterium]
MKIATILCRAGTMDNYAYIITDEATGVSAIIDAPETFPIVQYCDEHNLRPTYLLNTHHHFDHTDSNLDLKRIYNLKIIGAVYDKHRIPGIDETVQEGDIFKIGSLEAHILKAEGHTTGHILWYFPKEKVLFTGDVLFNLCVGGLFEGTASQMFETLKKVKALPDEVLFYPGHEYTLQGADFAAGHCTDESTLRAYFKLAEERLRQNLPVCPITLGMEKVCNPYLHAETLEELQKIA